MRSLCKINHDNHRFLPIEKSINDTLPLLNSSSIVLSQALITSIMNLHIVPKIMYSEDLVFDTAQEITTGLPKSTLIINNGLSMSIAGQGNKALGQVVEMDTIIRGGVLHWIDTILLPDLSILSNDQQTDKTIFPDFN